MGLLPIIHKLLEQKDFTNLALYLDYAADETERLLILDEIMRLRFCSDPEIQTTSIFAPSLLFNATDIAVIDDLIPRYSYLIF